MSVEIGKLVRDCEGSGTGGLCTDMLWGMSACHLNGPSWWFVCLILGYQPRLVVTDSLQGWIMKEKQLSVTVGGPIIS